MKRKAYRAMRYHELKREAISGADSRVSFIPKLGDTIDIAMWVSLDKQYVMDHYAVHDRNIILTLEIDEDDILEGNLTDRETELSVGKGKVLSYTVMGIEE